MRFEFIQLTRVRAHIFKLFNRVKSIQDEKVRFIQENELKLIKLSSFHFFFFKSVRSKIFHLRITRKTYYFIKKKSKDKIV